jgi:hypothetical protein
MGNLYQAATVLYQAPPAMVMGVMGMPWMAVAGSGQMTQQQQFHLMYPPQGNDVRTWAQHFLAIMSPD